MPRTVWIAERSYSVDGGLLTARVGQPVKEPTGEWSCCVALEGPGISEESKAFGEDSLQALLLGLAMLRVFLTTDQRIRSLSWYELPGHGIELVG